MEWTQRRICLGAIGACEPMLVALNLYFYYTFFLEKGDIIFCGPMLSNECLVHWFNLCDKTNALYRR